MEIINIKNNLKFLTEYITLCNLEWVGNTLTDKYIEEKINTIINGDKFIRILGLVDNDCLLGFIALYKNDCDERVDLTPWYASMYVKKEYRNKGYSKLLNEAILKEASNLGYKKVYLKTNLVNYYEKFGAKYIGKLNNGEKLYYFKLI